MMDGKIKIEIVQAHEIPLIGGGFVRRTPGERIEIDENEFCPNLHRRVADQPRRLKSVKVEEGGEDDKEVKEDGPRTEKR